MKVIEILNFNREILTKIQNMGIKLDDCQYIDLYTEYETMKQSGEKVTYIVAMLSNKYSICERKVYNLIKHFQRDCTSNEV